MQDMEIKEITLTADITILTKLEYENRESPEEKKKRIAANYEFQDWIIPAGVKVVKSNTGLTYTLAGKNKNQGDTICFIPKDTMRIPHDRLWGYALQQIDYGKRKI